ncbi:MAG TPA: hypothetical protein VFK57_03165 [Vicinamibacterales bacterium]|nr:hypothetical protein [Vicinamibacterales bacterium]
MRRVRSLAVPLVLAAVVLPGAPAGSSAAAVCESSLPINIDAGALETFALGLLQQSQTFRQQCQRLAAVIVLRVQVRLVPSRSGSRAETTIRRFDTGALRADIQLSFGEDYAELLAHEFEHVLEQVDRVSLVKQVETGQAWLTERGAYETARAIQTGARARHESELSAAEAVEANGRAVPRQRHPFQ